MRIRAAGGLLFAPVLYPVALTLEQLGSRVGDENLERALRFLFWTGAGAERVPMVLVRDGLFAAAVVVGVLAIFGVRLTRLVLPLVAAAIALGLVPWLFYDVRGTGDFPPRWVLDYQLWYPMGRFAALLWILVLAVSALLAATDFARRPAYAGGPSGPPGYPAGDRSPRPDPPPHPGAYAVADPRTVEQEVAR